MSSKQQYKDYSTRLKAEIKKIKAENESLKTQVFRLKMEPAVIKNNYSKWDKWKFVVGLITGMMIGLIILHYVL